MTKYGWKGLAATAALMWLGLQAPTATAAPERGQRAAATAATEDTSQARVIVKFKAGSALAVSAAGQPQHAAAMARHAGWALTNGHVLGRQTQSLRAKGLSSSQLAARLANHPDVEWVQAVRRKTIRGVLPNDPYLAANQTTITPVVGQWYLRAPDSTVLSSINAVGAWGVTQGSASITVAVIDTGVRFDHPDLAGKLWTGYDFISRTSNSGDNNGVDADASDPGDFTTRGQCGNDANGQPLPAENSSWHGTQVAGLIGAATDNGIGMASVGRNVKVLPVRVLGKCGGYDDDIIAGMRWAAGLTTTPANPNPARVINLSLGGTGACSTAYRNAISEITAAGVAVVIAAGNDAGVAVGEPANCPGAIAVAAVRHIGTKVGFSNVGPEVAIAAPGGNCVNLTGPCLYPLLTTVNNGATTPGINGYSDSSNPSLGTSFATPLVAGTVGLMMSVDPTLTPARAKTILQATARGFPTAGPDPAVGACHAPNGTEQLECYCTQSTCGAGLLDAAAAVANVANTAPPLISVMNVQSKNGLLGSSLQLNAAPSSRSATQFQWSVTAETGTAHFSSSTGTATTALILDSLGTVNIGLQVTDSSGTTSTSTQRVIIAKPTVAALTKSKSNPVVGDLVTLDSSPTVTDASRSVTDYKWNLDTGSSFATLTPSADGKTATLSVTQAGTITVSLTVTDDQFATSTASTTLTASNPTVVVTPPSSGGGGGGGAMQPGWLLGLALAVAVLVGHRRRAGRQR